MRKKNLFEKQKQIINNHKSYHHVRVALELQVEALY